MNTLKAHQIEENDRLFIIENAETARQVLAKLMPGLVRDQEKTAILQINGILEEGINELEKITKAPGSHTESARSEAKEEKAAPIETAQENHEEKPEQGTNASESAPKKTEAAINKENRIGILQKQIAELERQLDQTRRMPE